MSSKQLIVLSQMSVNRKGEKLILNRLLPLAISRVQKLARKLAHRVSQIFIIITVVAVVVIKLLKGNTFSYPLLKISRHEWQMQSGSPS